MNSEFRCIKMSCLCSMRRRLTEFGWNRTQWRGWETPRSPDHRPLTCLSSSVTLCVVLGRMPISWWVCMTPSSANSSGQNCTEFLIMSSGLLTNPVLFNISLLSLVCSMHSCMTCTTKKLDEKFFTLKRKPTKNEIFCVKLFIEL